MFRKVGASSLNDTQERILESGDLRVRFTWQADRYGHEVSRRRDGAWIAALASVEGTSEQGWPASPPFQSLHIEERDDGRTLALLVGMAGMSHWSASVEIDAAAGCVRFDVACRVRAAEPGPLSSSYRLLTAGLLAVVSSGRFGPTRLEQTGGQTVVVAQPTSDACPQTIRWDYQLLAVDDGGPS